MTALKQGIANKDDIKGSENYHDADPIDKQHLMMLSIMQIHY